MCAWQPAAQAPSEAPGSTHIQTAGQSRSWYYTAQHNTLLAVLLGIRLAGMQKAGLICLGVCAGQATALGPTPAPAPAPGPSSAYGCYTPLNILEASGQHSTLLALLDSTNLTAILDSPDRTVTLLAPTDAGIAKTLQGLGGTLNGLERSSAVYPILQYHILPSPVMVRPAVMCPQFVAMLCSNLLLGC